MRELTKAEEQIMQVLWEIEGGFVKDIIDKLPNNPKTQKKPAYTTVSTIVKILEDRNFVSHEAFGKSHRYYPVISKNEYRNFFMNNFLSNYFGGSFEKMFSFFVKEKEMDLQEVEELMKQVEQDLKEEKNTEKE